MTTRMGLSMARNGMEEGEQKSRCVHQGEDPGNGVGGPCWRKAKREFRCSILVRGVGRWRIGRTTRRRRGGVRG